MKHPRRKFNYVLLLGLCIFNTQIIFGSSMGDSVKLYLGFFTSGQIITHLPRFTAPYYTKLRYTTLGIYPKLGVQINQFSLGGVALLEGHWNKFVTLKSNTGGGYFIRWRFATSRPRQRFGFFAEAVHLFTTSYYSDIRNWEVSRISLPGQRINVALGSEIRLSKKFYLSLSMGWAWMTRYRQDDILAKEIYHPDYFTNLTTFQGSCKSNRFEGGETMLNRLY